MYSCKPLSILFYMQGHQLDGTEGSSLHSMQHSNTKYTDQKYLACKALL